jgi:spore coat polysaccharide biosynthesis protein SpsF
MNKIDVIIQARMSSSRLPGKVMMAIEGKPMLQWVFERVLQANHIDEVVVATTEHSSDDPIFEFCDKKGYPVVRGSSHDVLDRYYHTALMHKSDVIVRVTADCPLIDPNLIDRTVTSMIDAGEYDDLGSVRNHSRYDYLANRLPSPWHRTYPIGLDVEVFTFVALEDAWQLAQEKHQREHVTPYFYEGVPVNQLEVQDPFSPLSEATSPRGYHIALMHNKIDYGALRWTVDTPEDLELVRKLASYFPDSEFSWEDVLEVVLNNPDLLEINAQIHHKTHLDVDQRE